MMTKTVTSVAVMAALGLLVPINAHAFGLGKLELSSALNEPFKAEITITALKGDEADNLQVRLASKKEFVQAGIDRSFLLTQLKFEVIEKAGKVKVAISSQSPIREPFIDFLLTATTTSSGRLIREYTVLLDPPKNLFKPPVTPAPALAPTTNNSFQDPATNVATTINKSSSSSVDRYGPTNRKDTLWDVALKTRPEKSITVNQMMLALLKLNPTAFQRDNINGLKTGYVLTIPSKEEIYKLNKQQAVNVVKEQNSLWKNRNVLTKTQIETADKTVQLSTQVDPAINADFSPEIIDTAPKVLDNARLKLVVPNDESSLNNDALSPLGAEKIKELSEQLTLAQETIEGQAQDTIDFKARMDAMEEQMNTMHRLISLKDADLARLQSMLEQDQASDEMSLAASLVDNNTDTAIKEESVDTLSVANKADEVSSVDKWEALIGLGSADDSSDELTSNEVDTSDTTKENIVTSDAMIVDSTAPIVAVGQDMSRVTDTGLASLFATAKNFSVKYIAVFSTTVTRNKVESQIAAGGLLALLVGLLFFKRRKDSDDFDDEGQQTNNIDNRKSANVTTNVDQNALSASEVAASIETVIKNKTVKELIEQADSLVADSNYDQAMTLLEQAKEQEPTNQTILSKLLYILFKKEQKDPFVAIASKLNIDKDSDEWAEVARWGRELAPLDTLFNLEPMDKASETDLNMGNLSSDQEDELLKGKIIAAALSEPEQPLANTIEFDLDNYDTEKLDSTDSTSTAVLNDKTDNVEESLTFDGPLSLYSDNENKGFDAPLNFESEAGSDNLVLSLDDEPLSVDVSEEALVFEDSEALSIPADTDNLQDLSFELDSQPELEKDQSLSIDFTSEPLDFEAPADSFRDDDSLDPMQATKSESDNDDFEFDINAYDGIDEAETKLDLASAYADMGDPDGARSILEEVLNEGSDEQKNRAQLLLDNLS